jgi:hypothetical protein
VFAEPVELEPAQGGRSARCMRVPWAAPFAGTLLGLPKPCGARPRSVAPPCASHVRVLLVERFGDAPLVLEFNVAWLLSPPVAEGGLFCESWFWRADNPGLTRIFAGALFVRPADNPVVFMVWTGMCEAAAAGAVRAITERFCTEDGGVDT